MNVTPEIINKLLKDHIDTILILGKDVCSREQYQALL